MTMTARQALAGLIDLADDYDRSWSVGDGVEERFLLFFDAPDARANDVVRVAEALGMPADAVAAWWQGLAGADAMGLAVNRDLSSVRLYLQYWDRHLARLESGNFDDFILYRGIKSSAAGLRQDDYICTPLAPRDLFWPLIQDSLTGLGMGAADVATSFAALDDDTCILTRTIAPGRQSWLTTVRRAELDRTAWGAALAGLPDQPWARDVQTHAKGADLLHLAGGQDATKGRFTSLYFTATADDLRRGLDL